MNREGEGTSASADHITPTLSGQMIPTTSHGASPGGTSAVGRHDPETSSIPSAKTVSFAPAGTSTPPGYSTPITSHGFTITQIDALPSRSIVPPSEHQPLLPRPVADPGPSASRTHNFFSNAWEKISTFQVTVVLTSWSLLAAMLALALAAFFTHSFALKPAPITAIETGVGRLPFMGYNTWNAFHCNINETVVLDTAQRMKSLGFQDVGYNWINLDDCYAEKERSPSGDIVANKQRFPSGMNNLTDEIHSLGFKAGIYSDSGWFTCALYPGSFQNEERDAKLFHDWGFELLKYDNCAVPFDSIIKEGIVGKYERMSNAIANLAKTTQKPPLLFSLCEWGREQPWLWARRLGQSWRTTDDIGPHWDAVRSIIHQNSFITWASDFYGHNDMDILEVGNGDLTYEESKTHFTAWALMKSPLLISTDLSSVTQETFKILTNKEIIAINQDPVVGTAVTPFRWGEIPDWSNNYSYPAQYWSGESQNGTVFMLLNPYEKPNDLFFNLTESPWIRAGRQYSVRDLWTHTDNGTAVRNFTARRVPAHGVVALLLKDAGDEPAGTLPLCAVWELCQDKNGTFV